jgi:hypothetical protein
VLVDIVDDFFNVSGLKESRPDHPAAVAVKVDAKAVNDGVLVEASSDVSIGQLRDLKTGVALRFQHCG